MFRRIGYMLIIIGSFLSLFYVQAVFQYSSSSQLKLRAVEEMEGIEAETATLASVALLSICENQPPLPNFPLPEDVLVRLLLFDHLAKIEKSLGNPELLSSRLQSASTVILLLSNSDPILSLIIKRTMNNPPILAQRASQLSPLPDPLPHTASLAEHVITQRLQNPATPISLTLSSLLNLIS